MTVGIILVQERRRVCIASPRRPILAPLVLEREAVALERVTVTVGTRSRVMAAEELTVPVDLFTRAAIIQATPQLEMTNILEILSPSVYFSRAQIADITSGVRPFQLRGLSPDHSLVLINGKPQHTTAVVGASAPAVCTQGISSVRCVGYAQGAGSVFLDNGPNLVFDAEASQPLRQGLTLSIGAENVTNKEPLVRPDGFNFSGNFPYYSSSGLHMNGWYVSTQLRVQF